MSGVRILGVLLSAQVAFAAASGVTYEDLPQYGLVLIPPSSPEYPGLLADIQQHIAHPVQGTPLYPPGWGPTIPAQDPDLSAILVNRSSKTIASVTVVWRTQGQVLTLGLGTGPTLFDLFDAAPDWTLARIGYWHAILPGSKRYIGGRMMVGYNSDVRLPSAAEMGGAGFMDLAGQGQSLFGSPARAAVSMTLDGVFFSDGEFVGPNEAKSWEKTVSNAEEHTHIAHVAAAAQARGETPEEIFAEIAAITGPAEQRFPEGRPKGLRTPEATLDDFRQLSLARIAFYIAHSRKTDGDGLAIVNVKQWADAKLPQFRRK